MASKSRSRRNTAGRGFVNNTILECLLDGDKYGYEIIKEVKDKTDGKIVLKEPSLYSSLKRFEQKGYISSYWGDSDIGGRRHYYSLTEPGRKYFNNLKSPKNVDLEDTDEFDVTNQVEQLSLENINEEIYNIEEDTVQIDDDSYVNNVSFNVTERMNELLNENQEVYNAEFESEQSPTLSELKQTNDIPSNLFEEQEENEDELIEEISTAINEEKVEEVVEENKPDINEYMFDHKFRNTKVQEVSNGNEKYVQYDLFTNTEQNNYVDSPTIVPKETSNFEEKEHITANNTEVKLNKEIPLIAENEVEFFNWNELKRQAVNDKSSFSKGSASKTTTNKYSLDAFDNSNNEVVETKVDNNFKTTSDLHKLFNSTTTDTKSNEPKIFNNLSPNKNDNRIFDNVKDRIELNDAVLGSKKEEQYNDEPELTPEQIERLNRNFNEKFNQIAETKASKKESELDYKKILGDLYYQDIPKETIEYESTNYSTNKVEEDFVQEDETYEDLVDNDIEDEKVISAINKSKIYSYNTLKDSLTNDGFKFKPYSIDIAEEDTEQFVKINKVRFVYGTILSLIMLLQTIGVFICLKISNLIYSYDIALYVIAILASIGIFVYYLVPYITKKDERKVKFYNLNYNLMFGVLYLFCGLVLTYAINLIIGLNPANTSSFLTRLILPAILLTNFIIAPIIYKLVIENKNIK